MHIGYNVLYMISDIYQGVYKSNQTNFYKISRKLPGHILSKLQ